MGGVYRIAGRNIGSQYLVLGTWALAGAGAYLATRKKEEKKLNEGPQIAPAVSDPEEQKFIENFLKEMESKQPAAAAH